MIVKKCDICGAEMRVTTPRYKVTFDGWLYTKEKDICIDCFKRIADEIKQADTPQTEQMKTADYCDICKQDMCKDCIADATNPYCVPSHYEINYTPQTEYDKYREKIRPHDPHKDWLEDEPQTDCEKCEHWKYIAHEWQCETEKCQKTPQTDCGWKRG